MEKECKVVIFGDSIAKGVFPYISKKVFDKYQDKPDYKIEFVNAGISGETSTDGLTRIDSILSLDPTVVVINYGMNDWRKGVSIDEFEKNITQIVIKLLQKNIRIVINTINPNYSGTTYNFSEINEKGENPKIQQFNQKLIGICRDYEIRYADTYAHWKTMINPYQKGLEDSIHPNAIGYQLLADAIFPVLVRTQMIVLWQFNGRYAHCNYSCPYCYVATSVNKGMHFKYSMEKWEEAFERHFQNKNVVFYLSYGEPTIASKFYDVLEMIGRHPNWEGKITTNLSLPLEKLLNTKVAQDHRLNINASFHPTQIDIDTFLKQCQKLREHNIEPSIIYVMYPPQIDDFENVYMPIFRKEKYLVHIRAFRGLYKGKKYPAAYTFDEWKKTARYMDTANLKYQLGEVNGLGRLSLLGCSHILVDNLGRIEMCDSYVGDYHYGNLFDQKINLDLSPQPFPGLVPLAAVDDIADYVELEYLDLTGNNVISYMEQGGVKKDSDGLITYPYENTDFSKEAIRKKLTLVPEAYKSEINFWMNIQWFYTHFVYSFILKKYGKFIIAWVIGKWRLLKKGKLKLTNFWHA